MPDRPWVAMTINTALGSQKIALQISSPMLARDAFAFGMRVTYATRAASRCDPNRRAMNAFAAVRSRCRSAPFHAKRKHADAVSETR